MSGVYSFCLDCGPNVRVDEGGCCATCGRDAMGPALKTLALAKEAAELKRRVRRARAEMTRVVNAHLDSTDAIITESNLDELLDLRRPLPKRRR